MSEVPNLADEIERKAVTELQRVMHGLTTRRIGVVAACASLQTLWETTAGLISEETMTLLGQSLTAALLARDGKPRPDEIALLVGGGRFVSILRYPTRVEVTMGLATQGGVCQGKVITPEPTESEPAQWCAARFKATCESLEKTMSRVL